MKHKLFIISITLFFILISIAVASPRIVIKTQDTVKIDRIIWLLNSYTDYLYCPNMITFTNQNSSFTYNEYCGSYYGHYVFTGYYYNKEIFIYNIDNWYWKEIDRILRHELGHCYYDKMRKEEQDLYCRINGWDGWTYNCEEYFAENWLN